jgi:hypothetical protein
VSLARKGLDAVQREVGFAPEQRSARRLGRVRTNEGSGTPRVLFLTPRSWAIHVQWEAMVGRALAERGADVSFLTCGGGRSVCDRAHTWEAPPMPCRTCTGYVHRSLDAHGHRWQPLRSFGAPGDDTGAGEPAWPELDELDLDGLRAAVWNGLPLGRLLDVPVKWFLCSTGLEDDPLGRLTFRRFLRSGAAVADEVSAALDATRPDVVVMLNGLFFFEQIARAVCDQRGVDVVTYERGYVKDTVFFDRGASASRYDTSERWQAERDRPLAADEERALDEYLAARETGGMSVNDFWPAPRFDEPEPGFSVAFTNVTWDTAVQERERCFGSARDWLVSLVGWFADHAPSRLVVRAHPAEVRQPQAWSRETTVSILERAFPTLPPNVKVIPPDDPTSSYPLMKAADVALVYTSTAGMEAVLRGTPCITAADTQYGHKGFTVDPADRDAYFAALGKMLEDPSAFPADVELARRYAHFFFFRASLDTSAWAWEPLAGLARITDDPAVLRPGGDPALDAICRGILGEGAFDTGLAG